MSREFIPYHLRDANNPPDYLHGKQRTNWIKAAEKARFNNELSEKYAPLTLSLSSYEIIHVHRYTTDNDIQRLLEHIDTCNEFVLDSESDGTPKRLALIQLQSIPKRLPIVVILVAIQHLPDKHTMLYHQIIQIFNKIFDKNNILYSWGKVSEELKPTREYNLFDWPIQAFNFDFQDAFPSWYHRALSRCGVEGLTSEKTSEGKYQNKNSCRCHPPDPYQANEKWSLQRALAYGAELFIDKADTISKWSNLLDPKYTKVSRAKCDKLINYAITDCFAVSCFRYPIVHQWSFQQVKNTKILGFFQAFNSMELKLLKQSFEKKQLIVNDAYYDGITFISDEEDDDEIHMNQLVKPIMNDYQFKMQVKNNDEIQNLDYVELEVEAPTNDILMDDANYTTFKNYDSGSAEVIRLDPALVTGEVIPPSVDAIKQIDELQQQDLVDISEDDNDDQLHYINEGDTAKKAVRSKHQRRSAVSQNKRNRKHNIKRRKYRYRHTIQRLTYHLFTKVLLQKILRLYGICFTHIKDVGENTLIGLKDETSRIEAEQKLPIDIFNKQGYFHYRKLYKH